MSIRLKNTDVICWVPSAGPDYKSISNWGMDRGNKYKPNIFLFTDSSYCNPSEERNQRYLNEFQNDFPTIEACVKTHNSIYFSEVEIEEIGLIQNDSYYHISPMDFIFAFSALGFNEGILSRHLMLNGRKIWIDGDLDLSGNKEITSLKLIAGVSGFLNIKGTNLKASDINSIEVNLIFSDEDEQVTIIKEGIVCISFDNVKIILLPFSKNEEFYEGALRNNLRIDCIYAKNTKDDFEYIDTMATIGVKEAMLGILTQEVENLIIRKNEQRYITVGEKFSSECSIHMGDVDYVQLYKLG